MLGEQVFDSKPRVEKKSRNRLPPNPEKRGEQSVVGRGRFPSWLHRKLPKGGNLWKTDVAVKENRLHTVCEEAKCPNLMECWSAKTATFLAMGKECTRSCGFCDIDFSRQPNPLSSDEPDRIAESVKALELGHVVITMVARDDLADGGAAHLAAIIRKVRIETTATIEVLTSDFQGNRDAWDSVLSAKPDIFNYNIETVRELTPRVRHKATYERTLELLTYVKQNGHKKMLVKSGLMVGLGELEDQVEQTLSDLKEAGVDIVTIGQYLQANPRKLLVKEFVTPAQFEEYEKLGYEAGISHVYSGPFVRSSYNAAQVMAEIDRHLGK